VVPRRPAPALPPPCPHGRSSAPPLAAGRAGRAASPAAALKRHPTARPALQPRLRPARRRAPETDKSGI